MGGGGLWSPGALKFLSWSAGPNASLDLERGWRRGAGMAQW